MMRLNDAGIAIGMHGNKIKWKEPTRKSSVLCLAGRGNTLNGGLLERQWERAMQYDKKETGVLIVDNGAACASPRQAGPDRAPRPRGTAPSHPQPPQRPPRRRRRRPAGPADKAARPSLPPRGDADRQRPSPAQNPGPGRGTAAAVAPDAPGSGARRAGPEAAPRREGVCAAAAAAAAGADSAEGTAPAEWPPAKAARPSADRGRDTDRGRRQRRWRSGRRLAGEGARRVVENCESGRDRHMSAITP